MCEKQGKINEAYKKLQDGWLSNGDKVPPAEFAKVLTFDVMSCFQWVGRANYMTVNLHLLSFKEHDALLGDFQAIIYRGPYTFLSSSNDGY